MSRVRLTRPARADIKAAAEWYEREREGLGLQFTDRVLEGIDRIADHPLACRKVIGEARKQILDQFPYALFYTVESDGSIIIACLHHKRSDAALRSRVKPKGPTPS